MDQISEMLTAIRNAQAVLKPTAVVPFSDFKCEIIKIMEKEGFLQKFEKKGKKNKKTIEIALKYKNKVSVISGLRRVSKPGQRIYISYGKIRPVKNGYGIAIISTSKGLKTNKEAKSQKVGGELICEIW
ncbi:MAG: 30S ribosomal protein S8 [Patescibacteria group bacterium]